ncbi:MAG TPA: 2-dehydro-3-deoxygalactonokinase [Burkholderiaceae bacterium]|nr:2-dehydro-3-deoxygalactonokinase [Burkholderiaceae bacterium]
MPPAAPRLIALDWGTTSLRARLIDGAGATLSTRSSADGILHVPAGGFPAVLQRVCGDWRAAHGVPLIASGMVGSRQGWAEAPYLPCPAGPTEAAAQLARVPLDGGAWLAIVPGLVCRGDDGQADVMRGEETQLWGADLPAGACAVLPGTHSKWAWTGPQGRIEAFQTWMTGETFGLMTQHGLLGRLMTPGAAFAEADFDDGARLGLARPAQLLHTVFAARTAGLTGERAPAALADFLSGMLIGAEVAGALAQRRVERVTLIGEAALCLRYGRALAQAGVTAETAADDITARGQWRLARAAGLLETA